MADNQLFADWVTGDLITAAKLNQMKNDLVPWSKAGVAGGMATLDTNRILNEGGFGIIEEVGASPQNTTNEYSSGPIAAQATIPKTGHILALATAKLAYNNASVVGGINLARSGDGGATWDVISERSADARLAASGDEFTVVAISTATVNAGDLIGLRFGLKATDADGTNAVTLWGPNVVVIYTGS